MDLGRVPERHGRQEPGAASTARAAAMDGHVNRGLDVITSFAASPVRAGSGMAVASCLVATSRTAS